MGSTTLVDTLGMELVGLILATWLLGVNTMQAYRYFHTYNDRPFLKFTVVVDIVADLANTICMSWGLYIQVVLNWGGAFNLNAPLVAESIATVCLQLLRENIVNVPQFINVFVTQCFFAHSIYRVSNRNKFLTSLIVMLTIVELVAGLVDGVLMLLDINSSVLQTQTSVALVTFCLALGTLTDLIITISLVVYLARGRSSIGPTSSLIARLITYAVQRGLLITVPQVSVAAAFLAMPGSWVWAIFQFSLSKVYTYTFLAILNRRESLRQMSTDNMLAVVDMLQVAESSVTESNQEDHNMTDRGQC